MASRHEWATWWREAVGAGDIFTVVNFEERSAEKLVVRGDTLTAYVPMNDVLAADQARTLPRFMAELFGRIYATWAEERSWSRPPSVPIDVERNLPSRFP